MNTLTVKADINSLNDVLSFITSELEANDCPAKVQMQIEISIEEIFVNIAHYAYPPKEGDAVVGFELTDDGIISITFTDRGVPYDPLKKPDPDITVPASERKIGGLGIYMTKQSMDKLWYEYRDGQNILTMQKNIRGVSS